MASLSPFRAYHFNPELKDQIFSNFAPPYDIIDLPSCKKLANNPHNMVHITMPHFELGSPADVRKTFNTWKDENIITSPEQPGFYELRHNYTYQGKNYQLRGLLALIDLENNPEDHLKKHEATMKSPVEGRKQLMEESLLNASPIFTIFDDRKQHFEQLLNKAEGNNVYTVHCGNGEVLSMDFISRRSDVEELVSFFEGTPLMIADGHHRNQAIKELYQKYRDNGKEEAFRYQLVFIANAFSEGIHLNPTHRVVHLDKLASPLSTEGLLQSPEFNDHFSVEEVENTSQLEQALRNGDAAGLLTPHKSFKISPRANALDQWSVAWPPVMKNLPVNWINHFLLEDLLNIDLTQIKKNDAVAFPHTLEGCHEHLADSQEAIALLLPHMSKSTFFDVIHQGFILPQKTTYFYPKINAGWVIHDFTTNQS